MRQWISILCILVGLSSLPVRADTAELMKQTHVYKQMGEIEIKADVYRSADDEKRPVLVWIHGGALITGSRAGVPAQLRSLAEEEGFVLVSIDYRLAPQAKIDEIVSDVRDALQWIRETGPELFHADSSRIVVSGGSAGGYLTMMAGTFEPRPTALVTYWGYGSLDADWYTTPSEHYRTVLPLIEKDAAWAGVGKKVSTGATGQAARQRGRFYLYCRQNGIWTETVTGFDPATQRDEITPYCPVRNITADYPPIVMIHGTADTDVPFEESANMAFELQKHGVWHELLTVPNGGHGLGGGDPRMVEWAHSRALSFIRTQLQ